MDTPVSGYIRDRARERKEGRERKRVTNEFRFNLKRVLLVCAYLCLDRLCSRVLVVIAKRTLIVITAKVCIPTKKH